jgi:hypothetical protein
LNLLGIAVLGLFAIACCPRVEAAEPVCPPPKRLTCEQLKAKVTERCKEAAPLVKQEAPPAPVIASAVLTVEHTAEQPVTRDVYPIEYVEREERGRPLVGANVVYFHGLGLQAVGGYQFKGGHWQFEGGPMYVPQNDTPGVSGVCKAGRYKCNWTVPCNWAVPAQDAKHPWGVAAGFKYLW